MNTNDIISKYKEVVIQMATPYSVGTGFYLANADLIVTNEHVIRGNKTVVVAGQSFEKQVVPILYLDSKYDIAFVKPPLNHTMAEVHLASDQGLKEGEHVIAIGHPFDLKYTATQGNISSLMHQEKGINYIQHDAALNPGNSGGPLINKNGEVIGINTFIIKNGNNIGFSLPASYLKSCIDAFLKGNGQEGVKCISCNNVVFHQSIEKYCPNCGAKISQISEIEEFSPYGVANSIEKMINKMGYKVALTRKGPNTWAMKNGSALINISYHEKSGLLTGDVFICTLPENQISALYTFLLKQNYILEGLSFSIRDQDIILSLLIYDQYLNGDTMFKLFDNLLTTADKFDNILTEEFGAKWKQER